MRSYVQVHPWPTSIAFLGCQAPNRSDLRKAAARKKPWSVDAAIRSSLGRKLERAIDVVFADWRKTAAKKISEIHAIVGKADDDLVNLILSSVDVNGFSVDLVDEMTPSLRQAFSDAGLAAIAEVSFDASPGIVSHLDAAAVSYAQSHGADLVTSISETTRSMLRSVIQSALEAGSSSQDLASAIEDTFAFSSSRSLMIARTELAFAHVAGNLAGYRETGVVERKQWIVAQDNVCPECEALDGAIVDLDEGFPDGGGDGPPLHPNCRCDVVPVLEEQEQEVTQ